MNEQGAAAAVPPLATEIISLLLFLFDLADTDNYRLIIALSRSFSRSPEAEMNFVREQTMRRRGGSGSGARRNNNQVVSAVATIAR